MAWAAGLLTSCVSVLLNLLSSSATVLVVFAISEYSLIFCFALYKCKSEERIIKEKGREIWILTRNCNGLLEKCKKETVMQARLFDIADF